MLMNTSLQFGRQTLWLKAWRSDVAILSNLSVVKLEEADGTILEVVRWDL